MISTQKKEIEVYTCIEKAFKTKKAFIYSKKNNSEYEVIPFDNLFGAIQDIGDTPLYKSGIPRELIAQVDMSLETPKVTYTKDDSVAYYSPFESDTPEHVLTIVKLFNQLSSINITIFTSLEIQNYVESFSNSNISFCSYNNPKELSIKANKVITYGFSARSFIQQKIPTVIIGINGLGGWITPDNIEYLLKDNFKGRPSGRFNELIPLEILVDEFSEVKEEKSLKEILNENALIVTNYIKEFSPERMTDFIDKQDKLYHAFIDIKKRAALIPKLASNVDMIKEKETTMIQRREINDVLFSLPESDLEFLEDLKNNISCKDLKEKHEMDDDEFWEIMIPLWERKAIVFQNEV